MACRCILQEAKIYHLKTTRVKITRNIKTIINTTTIIITAVARGTYFRTKAGERNTSRTSEYSLWKDLFYIENLIRGRVLLIFLLKNVIESVHFAYKSLFFSHNTLLVPVIFPDSLEPKSLLISSVCSLSKH